MLGGKCVWGGGGGVFSLKPVLFLSMRGVLPLRLDLAAIGLYKRGVKTHDHNILQTLVNPNL